MSTENCKTCGEKTKYMYHLNTGLFCKEHWESERDNIKVEMGLESLRERYVIKS